MRDGRIVRDGAPLADHGLPQGHHHHEHDDQLDDHGYSVRLTSPIEGGLS